MSDPGIRSKRCFQKQSGGNNIKRIKLIISYDGTDYVGWQVQKNGLAVEQVINEHLRRLLKEQVTIIGASRTDSGVHAAGNVAVFDTETRIPSEKISFALNQSLPDDIKIVLSEEVPMSFHPRYAAVSKTYQYTILNARYYAPLYKRYAGYVYYPADVERMRKAAEYLLGEHDFTAFSSAGGQQKSPVRKINYIHITSEPLYSFMDHFQEADIKEQEKSAAPGLSPDLKSDGMNYEPKLIRITVNGNGFLYNMVRIIAGTLIKTGVGIYSPEHVKEILESCDRQLSAPKAAACGLTLMEINYS